MADQADTAVDPFEQAMDLIANSPDEEESEDLDDDEQAEATSEEEGEESEDAEDKGATEAPPKREVLFAGQKFDIPEGAPDEVVAKIEEVGKNLQADYTRKTQELVSREQQAAEVVQRELNTGRQQIQQAMQQAYALIQATGGIKSPDEMAQLAATDPQEWALQNARQQQLGHYVAQVQQQAEALEQQQKALDERNKEVAKQETWQRLNSEGIDRDGLQKLWGGAKTHYGLSDERLSQVLDADSWLVLRDAIAYRELKAQKATVTKQAAEAPKLPQAKKPMSKDDRARLDARKAVQRKGGASLRNLADFIATNSR